MDIVSFKMMDRGFHLSIVGLGFGAGINQKEKSPHLMFNLSIFKFQVYLTFALEDI